MRSQDIHHIIDVFTRQEAIPHYSRQVPLDEIEQRNGFNLNLPRYIDAGECEGRAGSGRSF
ncbi:N-6 DNA methylase [Endothiovibrio diazotrophicus]